IRDSFLSQRLRNFAAAEILCLFCHFCNSPFIAGLSYFFAENAIYSFYGDLLIVILRLMQKNLKNYA
uniref:hypothetical protein n=1 Tax=Parasutterella excrementihominis TaxID=487175 RepID=UPI003FEF5B30